MDAPKFLTLSSIAAEKYIKKFFGREKRKAKKIDAVAAEALEILENYIKGGKKARFALTLLGYQLAKGKDLKKIIPAAFAVELMHNAIVIHDDFMDRDDLRRGKPTVHKIFEKKNGEHYGNSMAILVGDVAMFYSMRLVSELAVGGEEIAKAMSAFNNQLVKTGYGQMMDIHSGFKKNVSWNDILQIRIYKTAHYTFVMPLIVGALLAGGDKKLLLHLEKYGEPIGLAFQIRDDILGIYGDQQETGKSTDSDIKEGKKTLLYFNALRLAKPTEKRFLLSRYGQRNLKVTEIDRIKEIIKDSGALESSQAYAQSMVEKGKSYIVKITKSKDLSQTLSNLADYMVLRQK